MGDVDAYLAGLPDGAERTELQRLHRLITGHLPGIGQTTSYSMPCYTYRDTPIAAIILRRRHIAWYPFSGAVLPELADEVSGYSQSPGTLRFTAATPLPDGLVRRLLDVRMRLIDERPGGAP
jgi:uncharacterized protein YdhG (YjbR/CyaY superfamily)